MHKNVKLLVFFLLISISVLIAVFFRPDTDRDLLNILLGVISFIFSLFLAYYIDNSKNKYQKILDTLREDDYILLAIYKRSRVFRDDIRNQIKVLIDNYLISQVDYYIKDYIKSEPYFDVLYKYILDMSWEGLSDKERESHSEIVKLLDSSIRNRKIVLGEIGNRIAVMEWGVLLLFAFMILFCTFSINTGTVESIVITVLFAFGILLLLLLLQSTDSLSWKENQRIWIPISNLFVQLDLLPFYPEYIFKSKLSVIKKLGIKRVRVARYPHRYPNTMDKEIKEVAI